MPQILSLLLLISLSLNGYATGIEKGSRRVSVCRLLLLPGLRRPTAVCPGDNCQKVFKLFGDGLDRESETVAYVGISAVDLGQLLKHGRVANRLNPFRVMTNLEQSSESSSDRNIGMASIQATLRSSVEVVRGRLRNLTGNEPSLDPQFNLFLERLVYRRMTHLGLTFNTILEELENFEGLTIEPISNNNIGEDYRAGVSYRRLKMLMRLMNLPTGPIFTTENEKIFVELFAELPGGQKADQTGFVLALGSGIKSKIKSSFQSAVAPAAAIDLEDVVGIDPLTNQGFEFLKGLGGPRRNATGTQH